MSTEICKGQIQYIIAPSPIETSTLGGVYRRLLISVALSTTCKIIGASLTLNPSQLQDVSSKTGNPDAKIMADTLSAAVGGVVDGDYLGNWGGLGFGL